MEKIRKKLIREKAVISIYQYVLLDNEIEEVEEFIETDVILSKNNDEMKYCKDMVISIIENIEQYKQAIAANLKTGWTIDRLSKMEMAILIVGSYEILTVKLAKTVVINEAVELTKKYCDEQSFKYINGVLNQL
ncbi:transcription antitermination factor NusB [Tannockella kyphosi]|uniref:transcription antitermination factor NusB n=1 Tax=Tannockella kyphosi TaxID=2899121 RepID=UPI0020117F1E|nr:transcription antitermination factor NusB [Tannockella kyphosi]